jgi:hypothetical protein
LHTKILLPPNLLVRLSACSSCGALLLEIDISNLGVDAVTLAKAHCDRREAANRSERVSSDCSAPCWSARLFSKIKLRNARTPKANSVRHREELHPKPPHLGEVQYIEREGGKSCRPGQHAGSCCTQRRAFANSRVGGSWCSRGDDRGTVHWGIIESHKVGRQKRSRSFHGPFEHEEQRCNDKGIRVPQCYGCLHAARSGAEEHMWKD